MKLVILAGGKAMRMGEDKAELSLGNYRLIDRVYSRVKTQCNEVLVSGNHDYGLGLGIVPDSPSGPRGPVAALYSVMKALSKTDEGFFTVPVDGPNLPHDLCERLYGDRSSLAESLDGLHQTFAWWRLDDLKSAFAQVSLSQSVSLLHISELCRARHIFWPDELLFYNINTPNDLSAYLTKNAQQDTS